MAETKVTPIELYNPVKFSVYRNASQAFVATTTTRIPFDTKEYDTSSNVDIVTNVGRFTAPIAGYYTFKANITAFTITPTRLFIGFYKNGVEWKRGGDTGTSNQSSLGASDIQLAANDYVEVFYFCSTAGGNMSGQAYTWFTGYLVSQT